MATATVTATGMTFGGGSGLSREAATLLRRHLDFQRLLAATEQAAERHQQSQPAQERQYHLELNRLLVFVRSLREQLTELYGLADYSLGQGGTAAALDLTPRLLQGYGFRVDALERSLLGRQQELRRLKAKAAAAAAAPAAAAGATAGVGGSGQSPQPASPSRTGSSRKGAGAAGGKRPAPAIVEDEPKLDKASQETVKREQEQQQALKAQLEELVGALKASTLLVHTSLREQNKVLDKTEDAAQRNLEGLQAELRKTEEQLRRSWSNSLTSCMMIFLMLVIFLATFLFMRLFPKRRWLLW